MPAPTPNEPLIPQIHLASHVYRQIRTLLYCSTTQNEKLGTLLATETPSGLHVNSLTLPDSNSFTLGIQIPLHASPTPSYPPTPLQQPALAATAHLSGPSPVVVFYATLPTFAHRLGREREFDAHDGQTLCRTALAIVLAGGSALNPAETCGLLSQRGDQLEVHSADADASDGVWVLGPSTAVHGVMAGLAAVLARRRNRRLGRQRGGDWVQREVVMVRFEAGRAWISHGWLRVLCGRKGVRKFSDKAVLEGPGFVARLERVRQGSGTDTGARPGVRVPIGPSSSMHGESGGRPRHYEGDSSRFQRIRAEQRRVSFQDDVDTLQHGSSPGSGAEKRELGTGLRAEGEELGSRGDVSQAVGRILRAGQIRGPKDQVEDEDEDEDEEQFMDELCRKYLKNAYGDEVRRRIERLS